MSNNAVNPRGNVFFVDISADDDLSEAMFVGHLDICGLRMPAALTSTAVTFLESDTEDGTYNTVQWDNADLEITVAAGKTAMFNAAYFSGLKWLKAVMGSSEAADRTIEPIYRDFN